MYFERPVRIDMFLRRSLAHISYMYMIFFKQEHLKDLERTKRKEEKRLANSVLRHIKFNCSVTPEIGLHDINISFDVTARVGFTCKMQRS